VELIFCPVALKKAKMSLFCQELSLESFVQWLSLLKYLAKQWKEFGDPRYELTMAALHKNQKVLTGFFSTPPN